MKIHKLFIVSAAIVLIAVGCSKSSQISSSTSSQLSSNQSQQDANSQTQTSSQNQNSSSGVQQSQTKSPVSSPAGSIGANTSGQSSGTSTTFSGEANIDGSMNQPQVWAVNMSANGFSPQTITILKGDYVQFNNTDPTNQHWPASNPHPLHNGYPSNPPFDALHALNPGEHWRFQFNIQGTWGYHDHLNPSTQGIIIVK